MVLAVGGRGSPPHSLTSHPVKGSSRLRRRLTKYWRWGKAAILAMVQSMGWTWFITVTAPPRIPRRCRRPSTRRPKNNPSMNSSRGVRKLVTAPNTVFFSAEA